MNNIKLASLFFAAFFSISCTISPVTPQNAEQNLELNDLIRKNLLGQWCGIKKYPDGSTQRWAVSRAPDGKFQITFDTIEADGKKNRWSEFGYWGLRYPIYFTHVVGFYEDGDHYKADKTNPDLYDAYQILEVDAENFRYQSYRSGNEFELSRECSYWF